MIERAIAAPKNADDASTADTRKGDFVADWGALLESCEATFNIDIEDDEAHGVKTLGDLYDVIRWKCQSESFGRSGCAVASAYRRLRGHLEGRGGSAVIRPTSLLEVVFTDHRRREWAALRQALKGLPRLVLSEGETVLMSMVIAFAMSLGVFGGLYVYDTQQDPGLALLAGLTPFLTAVAIVAAYGTLFARSFPAGLRTMGDLARAIAALVPEHSARPRARKPAAMWEALADIVRADLPHAGPVTPDLPVTHRHGAGAA